jgi:hypothetical protein
MLLVERARESMLWSWVIPTMGGANGIWGEEERREVRKVLGMEETADEDGERVSKREESAEEVVQVQQIRRETLDPGKMANAFGQQRMERPIASRYYWCESFASTTHALPTQAEPFLPMISPRRPQRVSTARFPASPVVARPLAQSR